MHRVWKLAALAAFGSLFAACSGGGGSAVPAAGVGTQSIHSAPAQSGLRMTGRTTAIADDGSLLHVMPTLGSRVPQSVTPDTNLSYHGGPVQTAPKIYVVYWGTSWSSTGDPAGEATYLNSFLGGVGGSKWLGSQAQYTQSDGKHVGNKAGSYAGHYQDTSSQPPVNVSQGAIIAEAAKAAAHFGDFSASASYVVALPHGVVPSGFGTQYCAYHGNASATGGRVAYTNLPYMPDAGQNCGAGSVNTPGLLDGVSIVEGHEQAETETDPVPPSGWYDPSGGETGDKCAWINLKNTVFSTGTFPTQPLWSNKKGGCVQ